MTNSQISKKDFQKLLSKHAIFNNIRFVMHLEVSENAAEYILFRAMKDFHVTLEVNKACLTLGTDMLASAGQ